MILKIERWVTSRDIPADSSSSSSSSLTRSGNFFRLVFPFPRHQAVLFPSLHQFLHHSFLVSSLVSLFFLSALSPVHMSKYVIMHADLSIKFELIPVHLIALFPRHKPIEVFLIILAAFFQIIAVHFFHITRTLPHSFLERIHLGRFERFIHLERCHFANWRKCFVKSPFYTCPDVIRHVRTCSDMFRHVQTCLYDSYGKFRG